MMFEPGEVVQAMRCCESFSITPGKPYTVLDVPRPGYVTLLNDEGYSETYPDCFFVCPADATESSVTDDVHSWDVCDLVLSLSVAGLLWVFTIAFAISIVKGLGE